MYVVKTDLDLSGDYVIKTIVDSFDEQHWWYKVYRRSLLLRLGLPTVFFKPVKIGLAHDYTSSIRYAHRAIRLHEARTTNGASR